MGDLNLRKKSAILILDQNKLTSNNPGIGIINTFADITLRKSSRSATAFREWGNSRPSKMDMSCRVVADIGCDL